MANGDDKNWIRLLAALDGFHARFGTWPLRVRMYPGSLVDLKEFLFSPALFSKLRQKVLLIAEEDAGFIAEDDAGHRYSYAEGVPEHPPQPEAHAWLQVEPDYGEAHRRAVQHVKKLEAKYGMYAMVSPQQAKQVPYPFVKVEPDGSARELEANERAFLEEEFLPFDGGRPWIKDTYETRNGREPSKAFANAPSSPLICPLRPYRRKISAPIPAARRRSHG
jgi:hypothetical protein